FILDNENNQAPQGAGYPKFTATIVKPDDSIVVDVSDQVMLLKEGSSYFYNYTVPVAPDNSLLSIRYESDIEGDIEQIESDYKIGSSAATSVYNLYPIGDNTSGQTDQSTSANDALYKDGLAFTAFDFKKVEVYDNAECTGTIIETITAITEGGVSSNEYAYSIAAIVTPGTYFLKAFIELVEGEGDTTFINPLYNMAVQIGSFPPGPAETTRVYLNVLDITGNTDIDGEVTVKMNIRNAQYSNAVVHQEIENYNINDEGQVFYINADGETIRA
ncbi:unnamed protein product, partial [marine sediment metagenome]